MSNNRSLRTQTPQDRLRNQLGGMLGRMWKHTPTGNLYKFNGFELRPDDSVVIYTDVKEFTSDVPGLPILLVAFEEVAVLPARPMLPVDEVEAQAISLLDLTDTNEILLDELKAFRKGVGDKKAIARLNAVGGGGGQNHGKRQAESTGNGGHQKHRATVSALTPTG